MMNKNQSKGLLKWIKPFKFSLILPVIFLLILACNQESLPEVGERTITGIITNAEGKSLPGVNIVLDGTQIGTISDIQGKYKLLVPSSDGSITYSFIGFHSVTVGATERQIIDVQLEEDPEAELTIPAPKFQASTTFTNNENSKIVTGIVTDNDGTPLKDIKIMTLVNGAINIATTTNSKGEYSFEIEDDTNMIFFHKSKKEVIVKRIEGN